MSTPCRRMWRARTKTVALDLNTDAHFWVIGLKLSMISGITALICFINLIYFSKAHRKSVRDPFMTRHNRKTSRKAGMPPGSLIHIGERKTHSPQITVFTYNATAFTENQPSSLPKALALCKTGRCCWLNLDGLHQTELLDGLGQDFAIHALTLEDVLNTNQRPKLEIFDRYLFVVLRMVTLDADQHLQTEQISLILAAHCLLSFQEHPGDVFEPVRQRLRSGAGRLRQTGSDYLAYALIDALVDNYFAVLEVLGEKLENLEDEVITDPSPASLQRIHAVKRDLIYLRKQVWPMRELMNGLLKGDSALIEAETRVFLRDVYDHTIQIMDTIESYRDLAAGILDLYLSGSSQRLNEIMKVLTMIATVFIPLTFVAGIYGMNFSYMPELEWRWGYFGILGLMLFIALLLLLFFKRKRWL